MTHLNSCQELWLLAGVHDTKVLKLPCIESAEAGQSVMAIEDEDREEVAKAKWGQQLLDTAGLNLATLASLDRSNLGTRKGTGDGFHIKELESANPAPAPPSPCPIGICFKHIYEVPPMESQSFPEVQFLAICKYCW